MATARAPVTVTTPYRWGPDESWKVKCFTKERPFLSVDATEKWLPLWRTLIRTRDEMRDLKSRIALARQGNLERLKLMYRPELSTLEAPARAQLLVALVVLISFESWDLMRDHFGLSPEEARDVWRSAIDRMLPPTPPA